MREKKFSPQLQPIVIILIMVDTIGGGDRHGGGGRTGGRRRRDDAAGRVWSSQNSCKTDVRKKFLE